MSNEGCSNEQTAVNESFTNQLVTFTDVAATYIICEDIFVEYRQKRKLASTVEDWVGIFPVTWTTLDDCVVKQTVPRPTRRNKKILQKVVKIPANTIQTPAPPVAGDEYLLVYVTRDRKVSGISSTFTLCEHQNQYDGELGQFELLHSGSDRSDTSTCMFDSFFLVDEIQNQIQDALKSLPDVIHLQPMAQHQKDETVIEMEPPESDDQPIIRRDNDHVTLNTDFTVTPSGTTMMNHLDFVIDMDPYIMEYLQNTNRSLLPVLPQHQALIPYQPFCPFSQLPNQEPVMTCAVDPTKDNINLSVLSTLLSDAPTPPLEQTKNTLNNSCRNCSKKNREYKLCRSKLRRTRTEQKRQLNELNQLRNHTEDQDLMLEEFSTQIKDLIHDNSQYVISNDSFHNEITDLNAKTTRQTRHIAALQHTLKDKKREGQDLEEAMMCLEGELSSWELVVQMTDIEREMLQQRCDYQECEAIELTDMYEASEALLDDVMYTLSVQGYTKLVDVNGKVFDLTEKHGSRMELYGWSMESSKRDEMHMINLAKQEQQIHNLRNDCQETQAELTDALQSLNGLKNIIKIQEDKNHQLLEKVEHLMYCMALAEEKEAALHNLLIQERRKNNFHQQRKHDQQQTIGCGTQQETKSVGCSTMQEIRNVACGTGPCYCVIPPNNHKPTGTSDKPTKDKQNKANQNDFHSDSKLFRSYSDVLKIAAAKNRSCGSEFDDACKTFKKPKVTESILLRGEMMMKLFDNDKPIAVPTPSSVIQGSVYKNPYVKQKPILTPSTTMERPVLTPSSIMQGGVLASMYKPYERQPRQQDSRILQGNVIKNLFNENSCHTPVEAQMSQIINGNVLNNLFRDENEQSIKPGVSSILDGNTLNNLFSHSSDDSFSSHGSDIFEDDVLNNLFRESNSNESIEVLDTPEFDASLEQLFDRHMRYDEHSQQLSLEEFTHLLDRALSIVFYPSHKQQIGFDSINTDSIVEPACQIESELELIPLLNDFSFPDVCYGPQNRPVISPQVSMPDDDEYHVFFGPQNRPVITPQVNMQDDDEYHVFFGPQNRPVISSQVNMQDDEDHVFIGPQNRPVMTPQPSMQDEDEGYSSQLITGSAQPSTSSTIPTEEEHSAPESEQASTPKAQKKPRKYHYSTFGTTRHRKYKKSGKKSSNN